MSVVLTVVSTAALVVSRDFAAHDYPRAIRDRYGAKSMKGQRVAATMTVILPLLVFVVLGVMLVHLNGELGPAFNFTSAWIACFVALVVFNLYDLIVLDWLLFCTLTPRYLVLPGTEGMLEYRDYAFHARGFFKGLVISLLISLIVAGVAVTLRAFRWPGGMDASSPCAYGGAGRRRVYTHPPLQWGCQP